MAISHCCRTALLALLLVVSGGLNAAERSILVLDASGSMWGQLKGKTKIGIAREVIGGVLTTWPQEHELGLIAYGHRRKGDCNDIEELIAPSILNANVFRQRIKRINPKGKTPLTAAVKQAAERLRYTEDKATVILVSDGKETCKADPCAVATELEKSGVDFTTHVIGFDVSDKVGVKQLKCLAENTGGEYFSAKDASGLQSALGKAVENIAKDSKNLRLRTVFAPGGDAVGGSWFTLYQEQLSATGESQRVKLKSGGYAASVAWQLEPGDYIVTAAYGNAAVEQAITVPVDQALDLELNLNAATVNLYTVLTAGKEKVGGSWFTIYQQQTDSSGQSQRAKISGKGYYPESDFILPAGEYIAAAVYGNASVEIPITVVAGEYQSREMDLNAGILEAFTVLTSGAEKVGGSWFTAYQDSVDSSGQTQRTKIAGNGYYPESRFILNQGQYAIHASYGNASKEIPIEITANQTLRQEIDLNAGILDLHTVMAAGQEQVGGSWFTIYRQEKSSSGQSKEVKVAGNGYYSKANFILPQGNYRAHAAFGNSSVSESVDVKANQTTSQEMNLNAGRLKLYGQLSSASDKLDGSWFTVYQQTQDSSGQSNRVKVAGNGYYAETEFILGAGDYIAHASNGNAAAEVPLTLGVNENKRQAIDFNAGKLTLRTVSAAGGEAVAGSWFTLYRLQKTNEGAVTEVKVAGNGYYGEVTFTVAAGDYMARAINKKRSAAMAVVVAAGKPASAELILSSP